MDDIINDRTKLANTEDDIDSDETIDILDILLDEDNTDPIALLNESGRRIMFEQIAIIPHDVGGESKLYAILKPIDKMEDVNDDEALAFVVDEDDGGNTILIVETDEKMVVEIFDRYYQLVDEANGE